MLIGGNSPTPGFTERGRAAAEVLGPGVMRWLPSAEPGNAVRYTGCLHIWRGPNWSPGEDPAAYAARIEADATRWRSAIPGVVLQLGNEPDLEAGHHGEEFPRYAAAVRARFPGALVANPPLSVEATGDLTAAVCAAADYVSVHSYWETFAPGDIASETFGASYRIALRLAGGKPVVVTEVNAVPDREATVDWSRRNGQVAEWLAQAERDGVHAACLFILDGNADPRWPRRDVGPEAAAEIVARYRALVAPPVPPPEPSPPPQPEPTMNPYAYDGDYAYDTFLRMVAGPLAAKNPAVTSRENYRAVHRAARSQGVSVPTLLGWIVAENVDPDLIAINNLGGIKYVGQRRAYRSNVYPPPSEQGVYAGFPTLEDFWATLAVNIATLDAGAWARGDLATIARIYTGGSWGEGKVALVDRLRAFPHGALDDGGGGGVIVAPTWVTGEEVIAQALKDLGHDTFIDEGVVVPSYYRCEEAVEVWEERCGLGRLRYPDANADADAGPLYDGHAPIGARVFFRGPGWSEYGHTGHSMGGGRTISALKVVTITDGWQEPGTGYIGWRYAPGVGPGGPAPVVEDRDMRVDGHMDPDKYLRQWHGPNWSFAQNRPKKGAIPFNPQSGVGTTWRREFDAGKPLGFVVSAELHNREGTRFIQYFSNGNIEGNRASVNDEWALSVN